MWSKLIQRERRSEVRYQARLPATVIFLGSTETTEEQPLAALGTTRDISSKGLSFFVPSFPFDDELAGARRALKVVLALPIGYVIVWARLVWHEQPQVARPELGHLLAAQIIEMSEADRTLYSEYLQRLATLAQGEGR